MSDKDDGTRMIQGECRLEATSPWADDVVLDGLRLHLDLHIVPRASRAGSSRGPSPAVGRAISRVRAWCSGILTRRRRGLVAGIAVMAMAFVVWSMRAPSGSQAPGRETSAPPGVAAAPEPGPLPAPAAPHPLPPPAGVSQIRPDLVPPRAGSSAPTTGTSPAPHDEAVTRKPVTGRSPAPPSLAGAPPRAVTSFAVPAAAARATANAAKPPRARATSAREGVATFAPAPVPPERSTRQDMLDLFGDTK